jgi:hypothetical protein
MVKVAGGSWRLTDAGKAKKRKLPPKIGVTIPLHPPLVLGV